MHGMLDRPLTVRLLNGGRAEVELTDVLVVEDLPVPLHISAKARPELLATGAFGPPPFYLWADVPDNMKLEKGNFPERYREHPYWQDNGVVYLGGLADDPPEGVDAA